MRSYYATKNIRVNIRRLVCQRHGRFANLHLHKTSYFFCLNVHQLHMIVLSNAKDFASSVVLQLCDRGVKANCKFFAALVKIVSPFLAIDLVETNLFFNTAYCDMSHLVRAHRKGFSF